MASHQTIVCANSRSTETLARPSLTSPNFGNDDLILSRGRARPSRLRADIFPPWRRISTSSDQANCDWRTIVVDKTHTRTIFPCCDVSLLNVTRERELKEKEQGKAPHRLAPHSLFRQHSARQHSYPLLTQQHHCTWTGALIPLVASE